MVVGHPLVALMVWSLSLVPAAARATTIVRKRIGKRAGDYEPGRSVVQVSRTAVQAMAVAVVFDFARALAILARGSHHARRSATQ